MAQLDPLHTYLRMFGSKSDGMSAYWYFGNTAVQVEGFPIIPVISAETVMVYKTTNISPDQATVAWWEIGVMRDPVTGKIADTWQNPITGEVLSAPKSFEEGPSKFTLTRDASSKSGVKIDLIQAHAKVESVEMEISETNGVVYLHQTEFKIRGFPQPDGTMPSLDGPNVTRARTDLHAFGARADFEQDAPHTSGSYEFELNKLPTWLGFGDMPGKMLISGIMHKAPSVNHPVNEAAWADFKKAFPHRFDGDKLVPNWG